MDKVLSILAVLVTLVTLAAGTLDAQDQNKLVLPDDPVAAIVKMPVQESVQTGQRVQVVDDKGKPLPSVSVVVVPTMKNVDRQKMRTWQRQARDRYDNDLDKCRTVFFLSIGKRFLTGADGTVVVPALEETGALLVAHGRNTAVATGREAGKDVLRIVLRPDTPIHVLVLGPKGKPVRGVRVGLTSNVSYLRGMGKTAKTDNNGKATVHWGVYRSYPINRKLYVYAMVATQKPVVHEVDRQTFKNNEEHPIKLTLPNYGQVRVYVVDKDNQPVRGIDGATLAVVDRSRRFPRPRLQLEADNVDEDSATFSFVEVDLQVELSCRYKGSVRPQKVKCDGPRHYMDMRVVKIKGITAPKKITCRVLGLDGEPVLSEQLGVIFTQGRVFHGATATSDDKGRLEVIVPDEFAALQEGNFSIVRRFGPSGREAKPLGAKRLSFEYVREHNQNLGDVRLEQEKLIASGQVVDNHGKPIAGVRVAVLHGLRRGFSSTRLSGPSEFYECRAVTDAAGRFELHAADSDLGSVTLSTEASGHVPNSDSKNLEVEVGAKDAKIVLIRASTIHGKILGLRSSRFRGEIRLIDKDGTDIGVRGSAAKDGTFGIYRCPPGEYSVQFALSNRRVPILTIPAVKVEEGKDCKDPRLMAVDLSKHARVVKITVLDADGKPLERARVSLHSPRKGGGVSSRGHFTDSTGVCELLLPLEGGNVSVEGRNGEYRRKRFPMLKKDVVVQLERALAVSLRFKGMPKLPDNLGFRFYVRPSRPLGRMGAGNWVPRTHPQRELVRDSKSEAKIHVSEPGEYKLTLTPVLVSDGGRSRRSLNPGLRFNFTVKEPEQTGTKVEVEIALEDSDVDAIKDLIEMANESKKDKDR